MILEAVARYIERGLRPIPVWAPTYGCKCGRNPAACKGQCPGKVPKDPNWKDRGPFALSEFAETDSVALAMGPQPNGLWLVAVDVDGFRPLPSGTIPPTMATVSGRGAHYIFTCQPYAPFGNWVDALADKANPHRSSHVGSIDIRYARGAVVVGPSMHQSGKQYLTNTWEPVPIPDQLVAAIFAVRRRRGLPVDKVWRRDGKQP